MKSKTRPTLANRLDEREFARFLESHSELGSLITHEADLGCVNDINETLPTPRQLVALWPKGTIRRV